MNFKISYAITACNEHEELKRLLTFLLEHKRKEDEIVIQLDQENYTQKIVQVIESFKLKYHSFPLNQDFASFKNNLKKKCIGDYIFQIDADEVPSYECVKNLHHLLGSNLEVDLFLVPRINTVKGLTDNHIKKWKWNVDNEGRVNWPDYQYRIFKNNFNIKWKNKVHEYISGAMTGVKLPATEEFALVHHKSILKQEKQNELYEKIV